MGKPLVIVSAAVIERERRYLVTRRLRGTHLEGLWEFPGGKCEAGEPPDVCLSREILEELGCEARVGAKMFSVRHDYEDRSIELHFFRTEIDAEPRALLGQEMRWVGRGELASLEFPPADAELIEILRRG